MDSSNSKHSQPSSPDPGSGSGFNNSGSGLNGSGSGSGFNGSGSGFDGSGSGSNSRTRSGSGGSIGETSQSAGNNTPEGDDNSSSSMKSKGSTGYEPEDEEDMDVDITDSLETTKPEPESSIGKGKMVDTATATSSSSREGKAEEIGLLTDLYTLYNKTGRYLMSPSNDLRDFYKFWVQEEGDYASIEELDNKVIELHARFLKNMDKDVEGPTDPIDVEILRLSHWIWGDEIDSCEETAIDDVIESCKETAADDVTKSCEETAAADEENQEQVPKDSTDVNMADDGDDGVNPNDQSGNETAVALHGIDPMDLKDSTKESGPIDKDSSSKAN